MSAEYSQSGTCQPSNSFCTYGDPLNCELCSILEACCQRAFACQNRFEALLQRIENNYYASQLAQFCIGPSDDHLCDDLDQASLQMVSSCTGLDDVGDESEQSSLQVVFLTTGLSVDGAVDDLEQASLQMGLSCTGLLDDGVDDESEQGHVE